MQKIFGFGIIYLISGFLYSQALKEYIDIALRNNPSVQAEIEQLKTEKEKVNSSGTWDKTEITAGYFALRPETRLGAQVAKASISQSFPWFGTYAIEKTLQRKKSVVAELDIALRKKEIAYRVRELYYEIFQRQANIRILKKNKSILSIYEKMALAALENNRASMSDVLQIRAEKNALHARIFKEIKELDVLKRSFNRLLGRNPSISLNFPDSLNVMDLEIKPGNVDKHPQIQKYSARTEVLQVQKRLIKKSQKPGFKLGIDYFPVLPRTDASPVRNGADILMVKVGMKIPLFNGKRYRSQTKQVELEEKNLNYRKENALLEFQSAYEKAEADLNNSMTLLMAANKNIDDMQIAINTDLKAYETGILDYDKILRLQLRKIKFELQAVDYTKKVFLASARMIYLGN